MTAPKAFCCKAILQSFRTHADGGLGGNFVTQELSTEDKVILMELRGIFCDLTIRPDEYPHVELVTAKGKMDAKSPSQRLRAGLFVLWRSEGGKENFDAFYAQHMERLIQFVKNKLPER